MEYSSDARRLIRSAAAGKMWTDENNVTWRRPSGNSTINKIRVPQKVLMICIASELIELGGNGFWNLTDKGKELYESSTFDTRN